MAGIAHYGHVLFLSASDSRSVDYPELHQYPDHRGRAQDKAEADDKALSGAFVAVTPASQIPSLG